MSKIEPTVLWISGRGGLGKSVLGQLLKSNNIPLFESDLFVEELEGWCSEIPLLVEYSEYVPARIGCWLHLVAQQDEVERFVDLFFDQEHGFRVQAPICSIEGFMPYMLQKKIVERMEADACRVWVASSLEQLEHLGRGEDWYER